MYLSTNSYISIAFWGLPIDTYGYKTKIFMVLRDVPL